jgi:hypothetical protein
MDEFLNFLPKKSLFWNKDLFVIKQISLYIWVSIHQNNKTMKNGILIDPTMRTIEWVEVKDFKNIYTHLKCELFECVDIDEVNTIYVDEEFHYKDGNEWFHFEGTHTPIKGRGLILGNDDETGESCDCTFSIQHVQKKVRFMDSFEVVMKSKLGLLV